VIVFTGEGTVRINPRPPTEKDQLRQFSGRPELVERVQAAFVRLHPADLHRVLVPTRLEPDPAGARSFGSAQAFYRANADNAFVLDTSLPRSPWWLLPPLGDAIITFRTASRGTLTFAVARSEPEAISLFDRGRRRQICLYPAAGQDLRYDEDRRRSIDVLHHDLTVRFQPDRMSLQGTSTLRIRLLSPVSNLRLRLDDSLSVQSIRSPQAGELLYFRVRHQDAIMVSLGPLAGREGEISLTVAFGGIHRPEPVEREVLQPPREAPTGGLTEEDIPIEDVFVYSNRTAWHPQGDPDDYAQATLHLNVPAGHLAVTGGTRTDLRTEAGRTRVEYRQERPGKYITVAVGRLHEAGQRAGTPSLRGYSVSRTRGVTPALLEEAAAMVAFFEEEFGPFPYPSLTLVVIEGVTPGGHSPPGMIVYSLRPVLMRGTLRDDPASFHDIPGFFLAHELAHQWWGHAVGGRNYHERWLSEAAAQYAAALWIRKSRGEETFRTVLGRMARWALRDSDEGPIHLGHRLGHIKGDPQIYRAVVYDKGAYVLHMLRDIVGTEAFRTALRGIQSKFRFAKADTEDFREALEAASGKDLEPYFREWVYGTSLPTLEYGYRPGGAREGHRTEVVVRPRNLPGPVPLSIAVTHGSGRELRTVTLPPQGETYSFDTPGPPRKVEVNADRGLLALVKRTK